MMGRNIIETVLGAVVLVVAAFFLTFALKTADVKKIQGYRITANFPRADGLKNGSDVVLNGVKVGSVLAQDLITAPGKDQFMVKVTMLIDSQVVLPTDTIALIANESLLGGRYLSLEIGVDEENIRTDGTGRITHTQPPLRLDDLIGKLMFSSKSDEKKDGAAKEPAPKKADDDFSYGTPQQQTPAVVPAPGGGQPALGDSLESHELKKEDVKPLDPRLVEPPKVVEPPKIEPVHGGVNGIEPPKEIAAPPTPMPAPVPAGQVKKDDVNRRRYDSRTWYELQKDQEPDPSGAQRYVPSQDAPLGLPGRP